MDIETYNRILSRLSGKVIQNYLLSELKHLFINDIKSVRRFEAIETLKDLLDVLRKRNCFNPSDYKVLEDICRFLQENSSEKDIPSQRRPYDTLEDNNDNRNLAILPVLPNDPKLKVYRLIATEIGSKWRELGRQLKIREGYLDQLEEKKLISDRVFEMLTYFESNTDARSWKTKLLNAIHDARRKDLMLECQEIFDTH